jgi:hypothetical protein
MCPIEMPKLSPRLSRERQTMAAMLQIYCAAHHGGQSALCPVCQGLLDYATLRLERCRFQEHKPTCAKCPVHCYRPEPRERVRQVMRYAGPRMLWRHPLLALRHWLDAYRPVPALAATKTAGRQE